MRIIIKIHGMACINCSNRVKDVLSNVCDKVNVNLENKEAIIETNNDISNKTIISLIEKLGYKVTNIIKE